jgi:hypothetical protein
VPLDSSILHGLVTEPLRPAGTPNVGGSSNTTASPSHRVRYRDVAFEAKRFPHSALAIRQVAVGVVVAAGAGGTSARAANGNRKRDPRRCPCARHFVSLARQRAGRWARLPIARTPSRAEAPPPSPLSSTRPIQGNCSSPLLCSSHCSRLTIAIAGRSRPF